MQNVIFGLLLGVVLTGITGAIFFSRGYRFLPRMLRFPFAQFDARKIDDLSPIRMFMSLSRVAIGRSPSAQAWLLDRSTKPSSVMLIHLAWHIVSGAYLERFGAYPIEQEIYKSAKEIGTQNVDFIRNFQRVHSAVVGDPEAISNETAIEYFYRAPSLAERISGERFEPDALVSITSHLLAHNK